MRIKIGDRFYLNSDRYCFWITEEYTVEKGKGAGNTAEKLCAGYTPTFESCVNTFIEKQIGGAEIGDLRKLVEMIDDLKEEIRSWKVDLKKAGVVDV